MITVFGDNSCDNFVTFCFTQYGDFWGGYAGIGET